LLSRQWLWIDRRGSRPSGDVSNVGAIRKATGIDRGNQRLQVGLAGKLGVERLEPFRRVQKQAWGVSPALLIKAHLGIAAPGLWRTDLQEHDLSVP